MVVIINHSLPIISPFSSNSLFPGNIYYLTAPTAHKVPSNNSNNAKFLLEISSIFEWMPTCSVIIDKELKILDANQQALLFFKAKSKSDFFDICKSNSLFIDNQLFIQIIREILNSKSVVRKKILLRRFDKTIACIDAEVASFPNKENYFLIQFSDNSHDSQSIFTNIIQGFRNDIQQLKPYLNKPGKELLGQIIYNERLEGIIKNKPIYNQQIDFIRQERIIQLSEIFPDLSINELTLCAYLSQKISIEDIAKITGKTSNSLRVALHRIVDKTHSLNTKEFLKKLQSLK